MEERLKRSLNVYSQTCSNNHRQRLRNLLVEDHLDVSYSLKTSAKMIDSSILSQSGIQSSQLLLVKLP